MRTTLMSATVMALLVAAPVLAQTTITGQPVTGGASSATSGGQNAVTRPNTDRTTAGNTARPTDSANVKLESGASSFTKGQALRRLERAGFKEVKDLKKDGQGIWRGSAMREGKSVTVGLDFKGNAAAQ